MSNPDVSDHFDAARAEHQWAAAWQERGYAQAHPDASRPPYCIVMPPPNVTGSLHMGHALNNTLQDVLIRYRRMDGDNAVWIPGADHASIAVHWLIEKQLKKEGTHRHALGRKVFLARAWQFKEEMHEAIVGQQKRLGISCDWSKSCFTLDEKRNDAVVEAFCRLYHDGLIYRAERLVNWDPVSQTTVSDLEVVHQTGVASELYSFAYRLLDGAGEIVVATTRPETIFGDTAVAVHPDDLRYRHLIGKRLRHPLTDDTLPIIADPILVDPQFGSGAVKITPAHDFNDFEVGLRHNLKRLQILGRDARLINVPEPFVGLDVVRGRQAVKEALDTLGLSRGTRAHTMNIGRAERSGAIVEPMLMTQWYVRAKPLARPALAAVEHNATSFVPKAWQNTYFSWLRDIRDWCISRQLWWGHRIPAYYCAHGHITVANHTPKHCAHCDDTTLSQDEDVLDTWFSSALWPFSVHGWPHNNQALAQWYPSAVIVTSFDIIFFWVARMMMFGQYFMGQVPFYQIYIHALIRDSHGEKMSKTKGNVVNPLAMIDTYGCDAFRLTLTAFAGQGRDVRWDPLRAQGYQRFLNKVWQALRFVLMHVHKPDARPVPTHAHDQQLELFERWIGTRVKVCIDTSRQALQALKFNEAVQAIYSFVWDDLCDWYLEIAKATLNESSSDARRLDAIKRVLLDIFGAVARLLHPITPFFAEEIFQILKKADPTSIHHGRDAALHVMVAKYPVAEEFSWAAQDGQERLSTQSVVNVVSASRRIRSQFGVANKIELLAHLRGPQESIDAAFAHEDIIKRLCGVTLKKLVGQPPDPAATEVIDGIEIFVPLAGIIDIEAEAKKLQKELAKVAQDIAKTKDQLGRADFVARAPKEVVAQKQSHIKSLGETQAQLEQALARLR